MDPTVTKPTPVRRRGVHRTYTKTQSHKYLGKVDVSRRKHLGGRKKSPGTWHRYLRYLKQSYTMGAALEAAKVSRQTLLKKRQEDPYFAELEQQAYDHGTEMLEQAAIKRAKRKSDTLMMFTLKARNRKRFSERHVVTGEDGGPLIAFLQSLPDDE